MAKTYLHLKYVFAIIIFMEIHSIPDFSVFVEGELLTLHRKEQRNCWYFW